MPSEWVWAAKTSTPAWTQIFVSAGKWGKKKSPGLPDLVIVCVYIFGSNISPWRFWFHQFCLGLIGLAFLIYFILFCLLLSLFSFCFLHSFIGGNEPSSGRNSPVPYRPDSRPLTPTYAQAPKHFHVPGRSWHCMCLGVLSQCRM